MTVNINDPAFPYQEKNHDGSHHYTHPGMTLRDYFANTAMGSVLAEAPDFNSDPAVTCRVIAAVAYDMADAMLAERAK